MQVTRGGLGTTSWMHCIGSRSCAGYSRRERWAPGGALRIDLRHVIEMLLSARWQWSTEHVLGLLASVGATVPSGPLADGTAELRSPNAFWRRSRLLVAFRPGSSSSFLCRGFPRLAPSGQLGTTSCWRCPCAGQPASSPPEGTGPWAGPACCCPPSRRSTVTRSRCRWSHMQAPRDERASLHARRQSEWPMVPGRRPGGPPGASSGPAGSREAP